MHTTAADCQVLVVGAGPTGLVLAAELLARGIATRIVDKGDGIVLETRALGVHARTLEVLDAMGLADQFLERGQRVHQFRWYSDGRSLAILDMSRSGSRFPFMLDIPQHETELLLRQRVAELGGRVEPGLELCALSQDAGGVTAALRDASGRERTITADYVVGCDGAHSRVRHELGLSFEGHAYDEDWLLADVQLDWDRREDEVHAFFRSRGGPMIAFPMRDHVWRLVFPYTGDRGRTPPTLDEIQRLVDERAPEPTRASSPTWLANFRCHRRSTDEYRRGRVLLAGDAVHVHSPAGGQGMNTGIMDAHNLGWKLALVAAGRAPDWLLDSYGEERGPVADEVLALTHALVRIATVNQPLKRALRDALLPVVSRLPFVQARAVRRLSQVHVKYRRGGLTRRGRAWLAGLRPGDRAPDVRVTGSGTGSLRLYEVLRGTRHVLLVPEGREIQLPRESDGTLEVAHGEFGPEPGVRGGAAWLIRPDGYLAARGQRAIAEYLRQLLPAPRADDVLPSHNRRVTTGVLRPREPDQLRRSASRAQTQQVGPAGASSTQGCSWSPALYERIRGVPDRQPAAAVPGWQDWGVRRLALEPRVSRATPFALRLTIILALLVCIFVADTVTDLEIAVAVFYIAVILVAIRLLPKRGVTALAWVCVALTVLSAMLTPRGSREAGLLNAAISISAIGITTYLALNVVTAVAAVHESRAQLARMARLTRLGELTASIAHEVNQPLAAIVTSGNACLRWLDLEPPNVDKARASVERIIRDANRASDVIVRVRGLARGGTPRREALDTNTAILAAIDLARGEIDRQAISLQLSLASDLPPVLADPIQLQQVIANLILNAVEAMLEVPRHARELAISSRLDAESVIVAVADSGIGLSSDVLDRLFDAFWTTKEDGLGIGLTISRSIVESHGGRIWATPKPTAGAVLQFSLPAGTGNAR